MMLTFTGEKGIGFKSIFAVTSKATIFSKGFCFAFDASKKLGKVAPLWAADGLSLQQYKQNLFGHTSVSLALNDVAIASKLNTYLDARTLLFLRNIKTLALHIDDQIQDYDAEKMQELGTGVVCYKLSAKVNNVVDEHKYYLVEKDVDVKKIKEAKRTNVVKSTLTLAFCATMQDEICLPETDANIFTFLPVRHEKGLSFLVQGDFILSANRESIKDCEWNTHLVSQVPDAFMNALHKFIKYHPVYKFEYMQLLENSPVHCRFAKVIPEIFERLVYSKSIMTIDEQWTTPQEALIVKPHVLKIVPVHILEKSLKRKVVHPKFDSGKLRIAIDPFAPKSLLICLNSDEMKAHIAKLSNDELKDLYMALLLNCDEKTLNSVRKIPMFRTSTNKMVEYDKVVLPFSVEYAFMKSIAVLHSETLCEGIGKFGIKECSFSRIVEQVVDNNGVHNFVSDFIKYVISIHGSAGGIKEFNKEVQKVKLLDNTQKLAVTQELYLPPTYMENSALLEQVFGSSLKYISEYYLKEFENKQQLVEVLEQRFGVSRFPPINSKEMKRAVINSQVLIEFLDKHWQHYRARVKVDDSILKDLRDSKLSNGVLLTRLYSIRDMYALNSEASMFCGTYLPYFPFNIVNKDLQHLLEIKTAVTPQSVLNCLEEMVAANVTDKVLFEKMYQKLSDLRSFTPAAFEINSLILVPADKPFYAKLSEVYWDTPVKKKNSQTISLHYPNLAYFFEIQLKIAPYPNLSIIFKMLEERVVDALDAYEAIVKLEGFDEAAGSFRKMPLLQLGDNYFKVSEVWGNHPAEFDDIFDASKAVDRFYIGASKNVKVLLNKLDIQPHPTDLSVLITKYNSTEDPVIQHAILSYLSNLKISPEFEKILKRVKWDKVNTIDKMWWDHNEALDPIVGYGLALRRKFPLLSTFFVSKLGISSTIPLITLLNAFVLLKEKRHAWCVAFYQELSKRTSPEEMYQIASFHKMHSLIYVNGQQCKSADVFWKVPTLSISKIIPTEALSSIFEHSKSIHHLFCRTLQVHTSFHPRLLYEYLQKKQCETSEDKQLVKSVYKELHSMLTRKLEKERIMSRGYLRSKVETKTSKFQAKDQAIFLSHHGKFVTASQILANDSAQMFDTVKSVEDLHILELDYTKYLVFYAYFGIKKLSESVKIVIHSKTRERATKQLVHEELTNKLHMHWKYLCLLTKVAPTRCHYSIKVFSPVANQIQNGSTVVATKNVMALIDSVSKVVCLDPQHSPDELVHCAKTLGGIHADKLLILMLLDSEERIKAFYKKELPQEEDDDEEEQESADSEDEQPSQLSQQQSPYLQPKVESIWQPYSSTQSSAPSFATLLRQMQNQPMQQPQTNTFVPPPTTTTTTPAQPSQLQSEQSILAKAKTLREESAWNSIAKDLAKMQKLRIVEKGNKQLVGAFVIEWLNKSNDQGKPYDILVNNVKTNKRLYYEITPMDQSFSLSAEEIDFAAEHELEYRILQIGPNATRKEITQVWTKVGQGELKIVGDIKLRL